MKEKLEALLREGHLANQPEFERLHKACLAKAERLKKSRAAADRKRKVFEEKRAQGRMDALFTLEPKTAFLVAKHRKKIAKAELELDEKRLEIWVDQFLKSADGAHLAAVLSKPRPEKKPKKQSDSADHKPPK